MHCLVAESFIHAALPENASPLSSSSSSEASDSPSSSFIGRGECAPASACLHIAATSVPSGVGTTGLTLLRILLGRLLMGTGDDMPNERRSTYTLHHRRRRTLCMWQS
eukprot:CAMPEP_0182945776 /NCGR_PEP_ID=MMETSP0105_2-20130417/56004_1 /TAXON_ID=81532 ORGANISM="Acanthoeca-like sp., Strain 10tr" /NCGR_SAMPLE_ID=MMETSP0105_2 /ASSEMBLY_ACC=CAM_ASM_000205 /LENGTH=107 /DNA_ID=CAMNT_0025085825 /DNA_START=167 /DNA_END=490 /DNA_ORIENTATION=+